MRKEEADDEEWTVVSQPPEVTSFEPRVASPEQVGFGEKDQDEQDMPPLEDAVGPEVVAIQVEQKPEAVSPLGPEVTPEASSAQKNEEPIGNVSYQKNFHCNINWTNFCSVQFVRMGSLLIVLLKTLLL